jgi:glycosyltransferase involved in cell wall biosynthesis
MKILFAFENCLPSNEADAEVFITTGKYLASLTSDSWLHVPLPLDADTGAIGTLAGMKVIRARAPLRPGLVRHFCCGVALVFRPEFREADLVYTRNLWVAWMAVLFGQQVAFDHYRPWPAQIPPLQWWIYRLMSRSRFLINICHSEFTRRDYLNLGIAKDKLRCVHNGYEPERVQPNVSIAAAKLALGISTDTSTVVYTGRLNHKKGLELVIEAARRLPNILFMLVGARGAGAVEAVARSLANIRVVDWQPAATLAQYISAADVLLIPPSWKPLATFGSTVLPLKLFLYMASGRAILAGDTPDIREVLRDRDNALLCRVDCVESLVMGLTVLTTDRALAARLAATALADSADYTWGARAHRIIEILHARLQARAVAPGHWSDLQRRRWLAQSWRWLVHLIRHRSWVLPADPILAAPPPHTARGD